MEVAPIGPHGQIGVLAHLATHVWPGDTISTKREVTLVLLTTYERLGRFAGDLQDLLHGRAAQAVIGAEELIS